MIQSIIRFSATNKYLVIAVTIASLVISFWTMRNIPLDALPDLSDTQVIVYSRWDRSPDIIEDQVTYPIITGSAGRAQGQGDSRLLRLRLQLRLRDLRGRHRHLLGAVPRARIPLEDHSAAPAGREDRARARRHERGLGVPVRPRGPLRASTRCDELRSYQDWFLRYALQSVPGVAEVATVGGQVRQYQITVNPNGLAAYKLPLDNGDRGRAQGQQRRRGAPRRDLAGASTWCAVAAT